MAKITVLTLTSTKDDEELKKVWALKREFNLKKWTEMARESQGLPLCMVNYRLFGEEEIEIYVSDEIVPESLLNIFEGIIEDIKSGEYSKQTKTSNEP